MPPACVSMRRMKIAGLVVLAAVSGWFVRGVRFERPSPPVEPPVQIVVQSEPIADPLPLIPQLRADDTSLGRRNLFAYRADRLPVVVTQPVVHPEPIIASPPAATVETPAPAPVPFPWRYIGTFGTKHNRVAAFKRDGDIVTIRVGERIGDFVLRSIGLESVTFDGPDGMRHIPLSTDV